MNKRLFALLIAASLSSGCTLETLCSSGTMRCMDNDANKGILEYCIDGFWDENTDTCPSSCNADSLFCGSCINTTKICQNDQEQICESGAFGEPVDCEFGCHIDTISCNECETDVCRDGAFYTCNSGVLEKNETCDYGCNAEGTACARCSDGMMQCANTNQVQVCDGNAWLEAIDCEEGTICSNGECKETCDDGAILCSDGVIMLCSEGSWEKLMACDTNLCKNSTECAECKDDENSCTDDAHSHKGTYSHCVSGKLYVSDCQDTLHHDVSCHNESCGGCLNGSQKCESGFAYVCENGTWSDGLFCEFGCDNDDLKCSTKGECRGGETKCEDNALYLCNAGHWSRGMACDQGCDSVGKECAKSDEAECASGSRCVDGSKYVCQDGKWTFTQTCGYGCDLTGNGCAAPPECSEGQSECTDGIYRACHYGTWGTSQPCANYASCASATTCGECQNDAVICTNNYAKRCVNGHWKVEAECPYGCNNTGTACIAAPPVCNAGDRQCVEGGGASYMQTCADGGWKKAENCVNASCNGNQCGQCVNGKSRCINGHMENCNNASWEYASACSYGCNDKNTACLPSPPSCSKSQHCLSNGNDGIGRVNVCRDGSWVENESCVNKSCNKDGTACGVCKNDMYNGICSAGATKICNNGAWMSYTCPYGCNDKGTGCLMSPRKCNKGATLCTNADNGLGQYQSCVDGQWSSTKSSCNAVSCHSNECGECKNGTLSGNCNNGGLKECNNGIWGSKSCSYGCTDDGKACLISHPVCNKGGTQCSDNSSGIGQLKTCTDGQWPSNTTSCSTTSCHGSSCGECKNGAITGNCNNGGLKECSNGVWGAKYCSYGCTDDGKGCLGSHRVCNVGATTCSDNASGIGQLKTCKDGQWPSNTTSCNSVSCHSNECGVCKNGAITGNCNNGGLKECVNGAWTPKSCSYGCTDDGSGCLGSPATCAKGSTTCSNNASGIGMQKSCINGQMSGETSCGSVSCHSNACGSCKNGAISGNCNNGGLKECVNGAWSSKSCSYGCTDDGSGCLGSPATCTKGSTTCSNNASGIGMKKSCINGQMSGETSCGSVSCHGSTCGSCKNGAISGNCNSGGLQECSNGAWGAKYCSYGCTDDGKGCLGSPRACNVGATSCSNNGSGIGMHKSCVNGQWTGESSCGSVSCHGSACGSCKNGSISGNCNSGGLKECLNGAWSSKSCSYGCTDNGSGCLGSPAVCSKGATSCSNNASGIGQVKSCHDGQWGSASSCSTKSCNKAGTACGECKNGSKSCSGSSYKTCTNGAWSTSSCSYGCRKDGTGCRSSGTDPN